MDIVTDEEGNIWYGSRREGLLASYRPALWKRTPFPFDEDDYIRTLNANAGYFFSGTHKGNLYVFEPNATAYEWKIELFNGLGSIEFIRYIRNDRFIVGTSTNTYIVNAKEAKLIDSLPIKSILDVDFDSSSFYLATPAGVYVVPNLEYATDHEGWLQTKKRQFPFFNWSFNSNQAYLLFPKRTRSIRFDPLRQKVYASTKNGLYEVNEKGVYPVLINGKEVFSTSLWYKESRLYLATINNGIWIIDQNDILHLTTDNSLVSNTIIRIKATEDHLWLFEKNGIQVLNLHTNQILQNLDLPNIEGGNVMDIAEKGDFAYLTTADGVYDIPLNLRARKIPPKGFLDYTIINGKDTIFNADTTLPYFQNDVQFLVSSPSFYNAENVSFRYRYAVNNLVSFLNTYCNKPAGIQVKKKQIAASGKTELSLKEVVQLEKMHRTAFTFMNQIAVHILITDTDFSDDDVLAASYWNTSFCLFGKSISQLFGGAGQVSRSRLFSTLLKHEFGHLLGLVSQGTPMVFNHRDVTNGAHCDNVSCLMYHSVETFSNSPVNGIEPALDSNCIADLKANGGK